MNAGDPVEKGDGMEVSFNSEAVCVITAELLAALKARALASPRRRSRFCLHDSTSHQTHEMLIVFHRDGYMPPHRHPQGKSESYHLVEGVMRVFLFDDDGAVTRALALDAAGAFLYRLSAPHWHMPVPLTEWVVYHEVYSGPFIKDEDVVFPAWAVPEGKPVESAAFIASLLALDEPGLMLGEKP